MLNIIGKIIKEFYDKTSWDRAKSYGKILKETRQAVVI